MKTRILIIFMALVLGLPAMSLGKSGEYLANTKAIGETGEIAERLVVDTSSATSVLKKNSSAANLKKELVKKEIRDEHWKALRNRLKKDNIYGPECDAMFLKLPEYNNKSMSVKVKELYRIKFVKPTTPIVTKNNKPVERIYPSVVTPENMSKAKDYLKKHEKYFKNAHETWGVQPEVAVGLLMLETKLGTYLGSEKALWSLACMAASNSLESVDSTLKELNVKEDQKPWIESKIKEKSSWAYNEFKSLMLYSIESKIDGTELPGSVYGAIGYCQFMPSNIKKFGIDATGKGRVDLFTEADAIASLSNFLHAHGWKKDLNREGRHKVLMCYNRSKAYANTILAVADYLNPSLDGDVNSVKKVKNKPAGKKPSKVSSKKKVASSKN